MRTPTILDIIKVTFGRLIRCAHGRPTDARWDTILLDAAVAIRGGRFERAADMLEPFTRAMGSDAAFLNLQGIICEFRKQWENARRFYGLAMSVDPQFQPARQNIQRLYELTTFGHTRETANLGDVELRASRHLRPEKFTDLLIKRSGNRTLNAA